jgi:prepilin-type N-terminal cleavage/methylation domain-containing protein
MKQKARSNKREGFTLIEVLVGTAVFLVVGVAVYGAFASLFQLANTNQARIIGVELADEQFEIIRNMPYANIGIVNGIPNGTLTDNQNVTRGGITFNLDFTVRDVDLPFDGIFGSSTNNDSSPADEKFVQIAVTCQTCRNFQPIVLGGQIAPKNLEGSTTNGALFVSAIDAGGNPVKDAAVHVSYATTSPIIIDDTTNNAGMLQIVDVPPASNAYNITVSKTGYSTDQTYVASSTNPTPSKPPATVAVQQLTAVSFSIDKVSTLSVQSVTPLCAPISNLHFSLTGAKIISNSSVIVPKYSKNLVTDGSGNLNLNSMEWDSYTVAPNNDPSYDIAGINPVNPIILNPNTLINLQLVAMPRNPNSLMVSVVNSSGLPISGAGVILKNSSGTVVGTQITGQGSISQTDWSGGNNQDPVHGYSDASNIDDSGGDVRLFHNVVGGYSLSGWLESSTFDTGTSSNFNNLIWQPGSQSASTSVLFQFATSPSSTPAGGWQTSQFTGPNGTNATYYSNANSSLDPNSLNLYNNNRYARYLIYATSTDHNYTPDVSDASFTYTSQCIPPGQVLFQGLTANPSYTIVVSKSGYQTQTITAVHVASGWQSQTVTLPGL